MFRAAFCFFILISFQIMGCGPGLDTEKVSSSCSGNSHTPFFSYPPSAIAGPNLGATGKLGQSFTLTSSEAATRVVASILGTTGNLSQAVRVSIQADSSNNPSGTDLYVSDTITLETNVSAPNYFNFELINVGESLQAGTQYWLVVESMGGGPSYTWTYTATGSGARIFSSSWSTLGTQTLPFLLTNIACQ